MVLETPTIEQWLEMIREIYTMEKITYCFC